MTRQGVGELAVVVVVVVVVCAVNAKQPSYNYSNSYNTQQVGLA